MAKRRTKKQIQMQAIAKWLSENIDSHMIYEAKWVIAQVFKFGLICEDGTTDTGVHFGTIRYGDRKVRFETYSVEETRRQIEARGLGGDVHGNDGDRLIAGFELSLVICDAFEMGDPGGMYMGRGRSHHTRVAALQRAA